MPSVPQSRPHTSRPPYPTGPDAGPSHKVRPIEQRDLAGVPGLSKLKSSIRQTKRLLAKDTLEPGLRLATQRRLTSLQADLERAEKREVEKKNGGKYHMVKFFERQKLTRLIRRLKRHRTSDASKDDVERLDHELEAARVMLNYVLHYPNDKKYIALFPASSTGDSDKQKLALPALLPPRGAENSTEGMGKTEKLRLGMLLETRRMMEKGQLRGVPDEDGDGSRKGVVIGTAATISGDVASAPAKAKKGKEKTAKSTPALEEEDDFFESD